MGKPTKAYAQLYEIFASDLYAYGLHFTSNKDIIEDAIHDLFVMLYQRKHKLSQVKNIKSYLFISLRNELFKVLKSEKMIFRLDTSELEFSSLIVDSSVEDYLIEEEQTLIRRKLLTSLEECLTPREKEAIYHRYIHQLSIINIADLMGINSQSAKNLIYASIKKMRKEGIIPKTCGERIVKS